MQGLYEGQTWHPDHVVRDHSSRIPICIWIRLEDSSLPLALIDVDETIHIESMVTPPLSFATIVFLRDRQGGIAGLDPMNLGVRLGKIDLEMRDRAVAEFAIACSDEVPATFLRIDKHPSVECKPLDNPRAR